MDNVFEVAPEAGGRWGVKQLGGASALYEDKDEAVTAAVAWAREAPPAVVRVLDPAGAVESERRYGGEG